MLVLSNDEDNFFFYAPNCVEHVCKFLELTKHAKGPAAGKYLVLEPFQVFTLANIYGFRYRSDREKRLTTDVIIFIPRKASKSTLSAGICLYELLTEKGAEVVILATSRDQASIVFNAAKSIIESLDFEYKSLFQVYRNEIKLYSDSSTTFKSLSRETRSRGDGMNVSCFICDEAAQPDIERDAVEVLNSSMVARKNPLRVSITTASFSKETKFYEDLQYYKSILDKHSAENYRWFGMIYELDDGDNWDDPKVWSKVNPMHGISIDSAAIEARCDEVKAKPSGLNEFLTKTLNQFTSTSSSWLPMDVWGKCKKEMPNYDPESIFIGFDLSQTKDLNAICMLYRYSEEEYYAKFQCWLPENTYYNHVPAHIKEVYRQAIINKSLILTQNITSDLSLIEDFILDFCSKNTVRQIGYDMYNASHLVAHLEDKLGIEMLRNIKQSMLSLNDAAKLSERLILDCKIGHNGDSFIEHQMNNCEMYQDPKSTNIKIRKNPFEPSAKIDAIASLITAMSCSLENTFVSENSGIWL